MNNNLYKSKIFCVFTFSSTFSALKAEKILNSAKAEFLIVPTLREISVSCGLSVKVNVNNVKDYYNILVNNQVEINAVYQVEKKNRDNIIQQIQIS